jgi:uncharacterized tellurite resistance protein B-like protein
MAIAWADGNFDDRERQAIAEITHDEAAIAERAAHPEPISPAELARAIDGDRLRAENFLRTAVMVAIADGVYTKAEDQVLHDFCEAFGVRPQALDNLRETLEDLEDGQDSVALSDDDEDEGQPSRDGKGIKKVKPLAPVRKWLDHWEVHDPKVARFLCRMIPSQCPFERDVTLFGKKVVHIPAMCKLNPLYEQLVGLRFRALSYLADECGEDVTPYL